MACTTNEPAGETAAADRTRRVSWPVAAHHGSVAATRPPRIISPRAAPVAAAPEVLSAACRHAGVKAICRSGQRRFYGPLRQHHRRPHTANASGVCWRVRRTGRANPSVNQRGGHRCTASSVFSTVYQVCCLDGQSVQHHDLAHLLQYRCGKCLVHSCILRHRTLVLLLLFFLLCITFLLKLQAVQRHSPSRSNA